MDYTYTSEVTTNADGLTSIAITDITGVQPTLHVSERSAGGQEVWLRKENCAFPLTKEEAVEALPFLLNFLETGRLVKR